MNGVYEALAHPTRRRVVALLREREMSAGELAARVDIAKPTLSGHLRVLREAGLVYGERHGTSIVYHLHLSLLEESLGALLTLFKIDKAGPDGRARSTPPSPSAGNERTTDDHEPR
ncbi:metalloregulator ArsR/SmtB family transcription factor [Sphaerisporangium sp. TRM90804]|uniref:metalloregulator ArsR/SmtB family transcription factor n=1 Tax=Sphaerisporangium sp. TRM90804 TaxID=3031113 RepID=UPI00244D5098|nr:metalloregulator ArsR/SmtB family transcription factor [Sphaerisporangium sp. TRM90804]MDH2424041.1 metalloregulator ArsR/SmtB family transcription factor [Sphaerisporangium sp. TRM90804]